MKKIEAMHYYYGYDHLERKCAECDHLIRWDYHNRTYYKCTVYGCSHGESTDWRKKYWACGLVDHDFPEHDVRIIEILKHRKKTSPPDPDPDQMNMFTV